MFTVSLQTGFLVYLFLTLGAVLVAYAFEAWRASTQDWHVSEEHLCRCPGCNLTFLLPRNRTTGQCPRCQRTCSVRSR